MILTGSIRQSVQLASMSALIEEKKIEGFQKKKEVEMTPEERMLEHYKEQLAQNQEADKANGISMKVMSGKTLTAEEIEYLEQKNPELLKKYREMQEEKKSYERQLRNCKTKEEVERVRVNKINGYLVQARKIANNPVIPKAEKKALLEEIVARLTNIDKVHMKFVKSTKYQKLPREQEIAKERTELSSDRQKAATEMLKDAGEKRDEIRGKEEAPEEIPGKVGNAETTDKSETEVTDGEAESGAADKRGTMPGLGGADKTVDKAGAGTDDIAKKALAEIQIALSRLDEHTYNRNGSTVSLELDRETGKRIDVRS